MQSVTFRWHFFPFIQNPNKRKKKGHRTERVKEKETLKNQSLSSLFTLPQKPAEMLNIREMGSMTESVCVFIVTWFWFVRAAVISRYHSWTHFKQTTDIHFENTFTPSTAQLVYCIRCNSLSFLINVNPPNCLWIGLCVFYLFFRFFLLFLLSFFIKFLRWTFHFYLILCQ